MTMKAAAPTTRRTRREPAYYYQSATASIEGKVRFGEGCVVLPHVRVVVPAGYVLEVGPFTLLADFAEVRVSAPPLPPPRCASPARAAPCIALRMGSHNHLQSYARLHFNLLSSTPAGARAHETAATKTQVITAHPSRAAPRSIELMGAGNVLQAFSSLHARLCASSVSVDSRPMNDSTEQGDVSLPRWHLGHFNVVTVHTSILLHLSSQSCATSLPAREVSRGTLLSPAPVMPPLVPTEGQISLQHAQQLGDDVPPPSSEPSMPGRVSVEERLFQDHSSDDEEVNTTNGGPVAKGRVKEASPSLLSPPAATAATAAALHADAPYNKALPTRVDNTVYLSKTLRSSPPNTRTCAPVCCEGGIGLPRYGTRSVSELPTIIKRIVDEAKQRKELDGALPHPQRSTAASANSPSTTAAPEPSSPIAAAATTLVSLEGYVESVHPDLRSHTEQQVCAEVESLCRCYIRQYIDDADLRPVDGQYDEE